jgi:hypothetical protein
MFAKAAGEPVPWGTSPGEGLMLLINIGCGGRIPFRTRRRHIMDRNSPNNRNDARVRNLDDAAQNRELTEAELDFVSGGLHMTKKIDVSSPKLMLA